MGGGLIQITSYGTQDLTLTGNPEITFFNIIYRRYTNFGLKTMLVYFDNTPNFDTSSKLTLPKNNGDLLSKIILQIKLPKIDLTKINDLLTKQLNINNSTISRAEYISNYEYYSFFYNKLKNIISNFFILNSSKVNSLTYINDLKNYILNYLNIDQYVQFFSSINFYFNNVMYNKNKNYNIELFTNASLFKIINNKLEYIYESFSYESISYAEFQFTIQKNLEILYDLNGVIYEKILDSSFRTPKIKLCWINKIANYLFNSIDFYIGSNKIYSLSDTYINNYSELYYKNKELYDKMIGNNQKINKYQLVHEDIILYLPIPFWALNNYGLAFPLIALQYNSVQIHINTKKFIECIRLDYDIYFSEVISKSGIINLLINETQSVFSNQLEISALLEYIYLDKIERTKFAQSAHEYLIEQVQELEFDDLSITNSSFQLDIFHCCKDMFWFPKKYTNPSDIFSPNINPYEFTYERNILKYTLNEKAIFNYIEMFYFPGKLYNPYEFNYGIFLLDNIIKYNEVIPLIIDYLSNIYVQPMINKKLDIIISSSIIKFNGTNLIAEQYPFFNYLHVYNYYNATPQIGFNVYSLCLKPVEFQPSGSCNVSRISSINLVLGINNKIQNKYDDLFNKNIISDTKYKLVFQTRNFNVLRFIGGIGAMAYTY